MTENKLENVSSIVDNHQVDDESINSLLENEVLTDSWSRYHLIGDIMKGETPNTLQTDLSSNIAAAIAAEPTVLAPFKRSLGEKIKAKVIHLSKPLGQVAIAASAAAVMIFGVQQHSADNQVAPNPVFKTMPLGGYANAVSYDVAQTEQANETSHMEQRKLLQALLADHQQQLKFKQLKSNTGMKDKNVEQQVEDNEQ